MLVLNERKSDPRVLDILEFQGWDLHESIGGRAHNTSAQPRRRSPVSLIRPKQSDHIVVAYLHEVLIELPYRIE